MSDVKKGASSSSSIEKTRLEQQCTVVLVDVAGTTTSHSFIQETLFKYVDENLKDYMKSDWETDELKALIKNLSSDKKVVDGDGKLDDLNVTKSIEILKKLSKEEANNPTLKSIQGLIYKKGYEDGTLKGHVYPDVVTLFERWSKKSKQIAVYSSGSVDSQKLLFKHTNEGDLTNFIVKYFDQKIGSKTVNDSYKKIAKEFDVAPEKILFISDDLKEIEAAKEANLQVTLIKRDGLTEEEKETFSSYVVIESFKELIDDNEDDEDQSNPSNKKRKNEDVVKADEEEPPAKVKKIEEKVEEKKEEKTANNKTDDVEDDKDEAKKVEENGVVSNKKGDEKPEVEKMEVDKLEKIDEEAARPNDEVVTKKTDDEAKSTTTVTTKTELLDDSDKKMDVDDNDSNVIVDGNKKKTDQDIAVAKQSNDVQTDFNKDKSSLDGKDKDEDVKMTETDVDGGKQTKEIAESVPKVIDDEDTFKKPETSEISKANEESSKTNKESLKTNEESPKINDESEKINEKLISNVVDNDKISSDVSDVTKKSSEETTNVVSKSAEDVAESSKVGNIDDDKVNSVDGKGNVEDEKKINLNLDSEKENKSELANGGIPNGDTITMENGDKKNNKEDVEDNKDVNEDKADNNDKTNATKETAVSSSSPSSTKQATTTASTSSSTTTESAATTVAVET